MSDYIPDFHPVKTLFQIGVKAVVKNTTTNKILILTRSQFVTNSDHADLPGGNLENFESPIEGIQREIKEETGLVCANYKLISTHTVNHQEQPLLVIGFYRETKDESITLDWESSSFNWLTPDEAIKQNLPYSLIEIVQKVFFP